MMCKYHRHSSDICEKTVILLAEKRALYMYADKYLFSQLHGPITLTFGVTPTLWSRQWQIYTKSCGA